MTGGARNLAVAVALAVAAVAGPIVMSARDVVRHNAVPRPVVLHPRAVPRTERPSPPSVAPTPTSDTLHRFELPYYVIRDTGQDLVLVQRQTAIASTGTPGQWRRAHTALASMERFEGSDSSLFSPVPAGGSIIGVQVLNGLATVNLSSSFQRSFNGGAREEQMVIYAIVNTVASTPGITGVAFEVDGRHVDEFAGHLDLSEPLTPDYSLVGSAS